MTLIVAWIEEDGSYCMAGDKAMSVDETLIYYETSKIWRLDGHDDVFVGVAGDGAASTLVRKHTWAETDFEGCCSFSVASPVFDSLGDAWLAHDADALLTNGRGIAYASADGTVCELSGTFAAIGIGAAYACGFADAVSASGSVLGSSSIQDMFAMAHRRVPSVSAEAVLLRGRRRS